MRMQLRTYNPSIDIGMRIRIRNTVYADDAADVDGDADRLYACHASIRVANNDHNEQTA